MVVIGQTAAEDLFGRDPIGRRITIGGVLFTVVGVLGDKGSTGFQDANDVAIAPLSTVQQSLTGYGALSARSWCRRLRPTRSTPRRQRSPRS